MAGTSAGVPTRRQRIKCGALVGGGLVVGCVGESGSNGRAADSNGSTGRNATTSSSENSYSVTVQQRYPDEFDQDEQLYDRQWVADIVTGNL